MKKIIALLSGLTLLFHTIPSATATNPTPKSFTWWCEKKQAGTELILKKLLKIAGTTDCKEADLKLKNLTKLDLHRSLVRYKTWGDSLNNKDMMLIESFDRLETLDLHGNDITNLDFLTNFKNLTKLDLSANCIADLKPLSSLTKLTELNLMNNNITNIRSLGNLDSLTKLYLGNSEPSKRINRPLHSCTSYHNKIVNLKPLVNLKKLTDLNLEKNNIVDITLLGNLKNLTYLSLERNHIVDIKSLGQLQNLTRLDLSGNKLINPVCPLQIDAGCSF